MDDLLLKAKELLGEDLYSLFCRDIRIRIVNTCHIKTLGGMYVKNVIYIYDFYLETFFHELGHHVFRHPKFSRFFHFEYLWNSFYHYQRDQKIFLGHQAKCSLEEFFAQVFSVFFTNHELLMDYDERLYRELVSAIEKILSNYS